MELHKQRYHRGLLFQSINCDDSTTRATTRATTSFLNCINFVFVQQVTTTADNHKTQKYCWKRPFRNFNAEVTSWGTPLCPSHAHFVSQNQSLLYVPFFLFWSTIGRYTMHVLLVLQPSVRGKKILTYYITKRQKGLVFFVGKHCLKEQSIQRYSGPIRGVSSSAGLPKWRQSLLSRHDDNVDLLLRYAKW